MNPTPNTFELWELWYREDYRGHEAGNVSRKWLTLSDQILGVGGLFLAIPFTSAGSRGTSRAYLVEARSQEFDLGVYTGHFDAQHLWTFTHASLQSDTPFARFAGTSEPLLDRIADYLTYDRGKATIGDEILATGDSRNVLRAGDTVWIDLSVGEQFPQRDDRQALRTQMERLDREIGRAHV